jgi:uncharacterized protein YeeX (DUF496 family)
VCDSVDERLIIVRFFRPKNKLARASAARA